MLRGMIYVPVALNTVECSIHGIRGVHSVTYLEWFIPVQGHLCSLVEITNVAALAPNILERSIDAIAGMDAYRADVFTKHVVVETNL